LPEEGPHDEDPEWKGGETMSKERKIEDAELAEISGAGGGEIKHIESDDSGGADPTQGSVDVPPTGGGGDTPEPQGNDGPGYQHYG
jgi:hypothetical protein